MIDFEAARAEFPVLGERAYFASHGFGPLLRATLADLDDYRRTLALRNRAAEVWYARVVAMRAQLARLVHAGDDDVALGPNATACQGALAAALQPTGARDAIVTSDLDFPSSRYLWHAQARRGFRVVEVRRPPGELGFPLDALLAAIDERTAVVALPLVAYANGALLPAARVIAAAHAAGAIVVLDASQAAGIVPIDVRALGVDALASGTNKWLSSAGMGLAFLYVRPELARRLEPAYPGWFAHADPLAFADTFTPAPGARRFETGAPPVEAVYGARAGIAFALEAGVDAIRARSLALADRLIAGLDALGLPLATPLEPARRAGMVCVALADAEADRVVGALADLGIDADTRPGIGLRIGCHPCNTAGDIDRLLAALAR